MSHRKTRGACAKLERSWAFATPGADNPWRGTDGKLKTYILEPTTFYHCERQGGVGFGLGKKENVGLGSIHCLFQTHN